MKLWYSLIINLFFPNFRIFYLTLLGQVYSTCTLYGQCSQYGLPNIFKSNKFYRHMALRSRKEKQLKRKFSLKSAKKYAVRHFKETSVFVVC